MVLNGSETDVDCGGTCSPCADGLHCLAMTDCTSGVCTSGLCQTASCTDNMKNGSETDVDCGGMCATKCADGKMCIVPNDCINHVCTGTTCTGPTCFDGVRNGSESDIDCGGSCARKCLSGQSCTLASDCASGVCQGMTCGADPLNAGLVGYWTMNAADITGTAVTDSSGTGNMAILEGTFASAVGKVGEALQFTGGAFLNVGDDINLTTAVTMSAWVKTTATGAQQNIVNKWCTMNMGCNDANQAYFMDITAAGAAQCYVNGTNNADYNISGGMVGDNNWHLVTCSIDKGLAGPNFNLYVDGALVASAVLGVNVIHASLDPMIIGGTFYGYMDDVRVYNRSLSASEVVSLAGMAYPAVPQPPSSLAASAVSSSEIDLSWVRSPSGGLTGYVIERSLNGTSNWFPVAVVGGAATTFADATLPAGLKFYYRVLAETPTGASTASATTNATTLSGAATYAVPNGLIGYWTGNTADINGTLETDASGSNNTATLVGGLATTPGKIREAIQSTVGQKLTNATIINPTTAVTMSAWFSTTQTSTSDPFDKWCTTGSCNDVNQSFFMAINQTANSGLVTCYFNGTNNADYNVTGRITVNDGLWHYIVCTADAAGTGNNIKIYVDGVLDADAYVATNILHTTMDPLFLSNSYVGLIDDLRVYNRAITSAEIHALFNNGSMGSP
jgi:hypothetical protein